MRTETKEVHITDDGKEFTSLNDAMSHEAALENEVAVDTYIASLGDEYAERAKSRVKNDIMKYLAFLAIQAHEAEVSKPNKNKAA